MGKTTVLVTGGTGFVAGHCIMRLLDAGYLVRTTVRSVSRARDVVEMLRGNGVQAVENVSFTEADLTRDQGWDDALRGCECVLHVATPISLEVPRHEEDVIRPAVEGTMRVLTSAKAADVKRVVLTSSFAAIGYGPNPEKRPWTENDWTDPNDKTLSAYVKSKALAERAAWDFMKREGGRMELTVINPMAILGPTLGKSLSSGHQLIKQLLDASMKIVPRVDFGIVDVRDVADLHIRAMTHPEAAGERFLALAGGTMSFQEIAMTLKERLGDHGKRVATRTAPDWLLRLAAPLNKKAREVLPMLGRFRVSSNEKAKKVLGWSPRSNEEAVVSAGESLIRNGLV